MYIYTRILVYPSILVCMYIYTHASILVCMYIYTRILVKGAEDTAGVHYMYMYTDKYLWRIADAHVSHKHYTIMVFMIVRIKGIEGKAKPLIGLLTLLGPLPLQWE